MVKMIPTGASKNWKLRRCWVSSDLEVRAIAARLGMECAVPPGRRLTHIEAHVSTFVDADGARGAGWLRLPSAGRGDGQISVLTCRPTTGLTAADCDTIIADYAARVDHAG